MYQDNHIAMFLENNGHGSSGKQTRHLAIRYYFTDNQIKKEEIRDDYCPTGDMVVDYSTNPLHGSVFRRFRDAILNINGGPASLQPLDHRSLLNKNIPTVDEQT